MCIRSRFISGVLCALLATSMLVGCSSSDSSEPKEIVAKEEATKEEAEEATEEEKPTEDDAEAEEKTDAVVEDSKKADITIEEQVLVDRDGIKVTAKEYVFDAIWGEGIKVLIENNSDGDVSVGCDALIVNDYMISDLFGAEVAAGKKSNEIIYLSSSELNAAGIDTVGRVELYFHAFNADTYDTIFSRESATIETSAIDKIDTEANDDGMELYNEGGIKIVGKTVDENSFWGTAILLYIENSSGQNVGISVEDLSVNGYMLEPLFSAEVYDGKKAVNEITLMSEDLEENDIETIEDVELKFHIYDIDTYDTIKDSDIITFSAK